MSLRCIWQPSVLVCLASLLFFAPHEESKRIAFTPGIIESPSSLDEGEKWVSTECWGNLEERKAKADAARQAAVESLLADAKRLIALKQYRLARRVAEQVLIISPNNSRAWTIREAMKVIVFIDGYIPMEPGYPSLP